MGDYQWKNERSATLFTEFLTMSLARSWDEDRKEVELATLRGKIDEILTLEPENGKQAFWAHACQIYCECAITTMNEKDASDAIDFGNKALRQYAAERNLNSEHLYILYESLAGAHFIRQDYPRASDCCKKALSIEPTSERMLSMLAILEN